MSTLVDKIRKIPDHPKKGILFYDLTTVFQDPVEFGSVIEAMCEPFYRQKVEVVCAIEARGFILGSAIANELGAGFVPIRKAGKLPYKKHSESYTLEYGNDSLEIHEDAVTKGQKVLLVDDLLATGGTAAAGIQLLKKCGADLVGVSFVIELADLKGRDKLKDCKVNSLAIV
jgi:adenine phosphoribosyltransferase